MVSSKLKQFEARITVMPRRVVLDPQGKAISSALSRLGFDQVQGVRAGKSFAVTLEAEDAARAEQALRDMCEKLLANTIMEDYTIELSSAEDAP